MIAQMPPIADSPLKDRVIFVQGAPRSGTTWLMMQLATHPQITGVEAESHLFEYGVDHLFDNFEGRNARLRGLSTFLEREQLVDLVRDLCDGVFLSMAANVNGGSRPEFVAEKTPTSRPQASLDLRRKRECYPDGWYLHIVRDREAVKRSLMKAPWMANRSEENCGRVWDDCVGYTRECLGDHPRYLEVRFEDMVADPVGVAKGVFESIGIDAGDTTLQTILSLSQERFSEHGAVVGTETRPTRIPLRARQIKSVGRAALRRLQTGSAGETDAAAEQEPNLAFEFVRALRERDEPALRDLTTDSFSLTLRSPSGDLTMEKENARQALLDLAHELFDTRFVSEWWGSAEGGPRSWWCRRPGLDLWTIFFSAIGGDASRIDIAFALTPDDGRRIDDALVLSAGPLSGRPLGPMPVGAAASGTD